MVTAKIGGISDDGFIVDSIAYQLGGINNQITDEFGSDNDMAVTGGGRGWTAKTTINGEVFSAKGTSKVGAAQALYDSLSAEPETAPRIPVRVLPVDDDDEMTEAEIERCVAECMVSVRDYCECKCGGTNHGLGMARPERLVPLATVKGKKACACGCGQVTQRTYVPGHDARHHARINLHKWAAANGITGTDEALRKLKAAEARKAARDRRAAKRAVAKDRIEAVIAAPVAAKQDDLPF